MRGYCKAHKKFRTQPKNYQDCLFSEGPKGVTHRRYDLKSLWIEAMGVISVLDTCHLSQNRNSSV